MANGAVERSFFLVEPGAEIFVSQAAQKSGWVSVETDFNQRVLVVGRLDSGESGEMVLGVVGGLWLDEEACVDLTFQGRWSSVWLPGGNPVKVPFPQNGLVNPYEMTGGE